ncbi:MAG TPA: vitamin K epoxide reductase family protein [Chitinophagaceae bacterium]|nr:vitamin K epoxide reductase family protein [Chitinophagaceae bacterium]
MKYTLSGRDQDQVERMLHLGILILQKLNVQFTRDYLQESIVKCYDLIFNSSSETAENNDEVADRNDPSNLALALLEALKKYNIKYTVVEEPVVSKDSALIVIRSGATDNESFNDLVHLHSPWGERSEDAVQTYVLLKKTEFSREPYYEFNYKRQRLSNLSQVLSGSIVTIALAAALYIGFSNLQLAVWLPELLILGLGIFLSYNIFLLDKTNKANSYLVKRFCSNSNNKTGCKDVLASKGSKLFGVISMTDIGMVYFGSLFTFLLFSILTSRYAENLGLFFWCAALPVGFTFYSIYYQLSVIKKVCVLCMFVQALLWIHFAYFLFITRNSGIPAIDMAGAVQLALVALGVAIIYSLFEKTTGLQRSVTQLSLKAYNNKNNLDYFDADVNRQKAFNEPELGGMTTFGNMESTVRLTGIISLACAPCGEMFKRLLSLANWFEDGIYIRIIFKGDELTGPLVRHVLYLSLLKDEKEIVAFVNRWFAFLEERSAKGDKLADIIQRWTSENQMMKADPELKFIYDSYLDWANNQFIPYTPLLALNNRLLAETYYDTDILKNIIEKKLEENTVLEEA